MFQDIHEWLSEGFIATDFVQSQETKAELEHLLTRFDTVRSLRVEQERPGQVRVSC